MVSMITPLFCVVNIKFLNPRGEDCVSGQEYSFGTSTRCRPLPSDLNVGRAGWLPFYKRSGMAQISLVMLHPLLAQCKTIMQALNGRSST